MVCNATGKQPPHGRRPGDADGLLGRQHKLGEKRDGNRNSKDQAAGLLQGRDMLEEHHAHTCRPHTDLLALNIVRRQALGFMRPEKLYALLHCTMNTHTQQ